MVELSATSGESLIWFLVVPLLAALVSLVVRAPRLREALVLLIALGLFGMVASYFDDVMAGSVIRQDVWQLISGVNIALSIDGFGLIFMLIASGLWAVTTLYASGYMDTAKEVRLGRFFAYFSIAIAATMGLAMADNLLTLFLFYEILTLSTYPLVTHKKTDEARRSGRIYLGILLSTSILFFLPAILATYYFTGTLDFVPGGILAGHVSAPMAGFLLLLFVFGIGKTAIMPMHRWLPAAMVAPTPVSALLHAVAVVKAGVFTLVKVVGFIFGVDFLAGLASASVWQGGWLMYLAGFTVISASVVALTQDSLKKRLAYSTISQLSYIVLALSLFSPLGIAAAMLHIAAHAVSKITLFYAAGAIYTASKKTLVSQLGGIGRRMPWTMAAFSVGALSMIGIPLAAGFASKVAILDGALSVQNWFVILVLVTSTMLNAAYFLPIIFEAYFGKEAGRVARGVKKVHGEASVRQVVAMMVTAVLTVLLFVWPELVLRLIEVGM